MRTDSIFFKAFNVEPSAITSTRRVVVFSQVVVVFSQVVKFIAVVLLMLLVTVTLKG